MIKMAIDNRVNFLIIYKQADNLALSGCKGKYLIAFRHKIKNHR